MSSIVKIFILVSMDCVFGLCGYVLGLFYSEQTKCSMVRRVIFRLQIVALSLKCVFVNLDNNQLRTQIKDFDSNALITRSKMGSYL